jgi:hypothetical protein
VVAPRSKRGRPALAPAALGGVVLVASAVRSWAEPAHVPWPSYVDGVPDVISHPSDLLFRLAAALVGVAALAVVVRARRRRSWVLLEALGLGALALGLAGLTTVSHYRGFGSLVANDMTLTGFRHGALNYVELAGASLLCLSPLAALSASRSTGR